MAHLRVLVVDDAPDFLASAVQLLARDSRLDVVGCAADGREAVRLAETLDPDLILMDVAMPNMNGFAAAAAIKQRHLRARVWLMSLHNGPEYHRNAAIAGADCFVDKQDLPDAVTALLDHWEE